MTKSLGDSVVNPINRNINADRLPRKYQLTHSISKHSDKQMIVGDEERENVRPKQSLSDIHNKASTQEIYMPNSQ